MRKPKALPPLRTRKCRVDMVLSTEKRTIEDWTVESVTC